MGVTITGADDSVDPCDLANLSERFPFVEWAILFSRKREGTPRYPSRAWRQRFFHELIESRDAQGQNEIRSAIHLCGEVSREAIAGNYGRMRNELWLVDRWQLNGYESGSTAGLERIAKRLPPLVLQAREEGGAFEDVANDASIVGHRASLLFDPSGGAGNARRWPDELIGHGVPFGIAGGIGPATVAAALDAGKRAWARRGSTWSLAYETSEIDSTWSACCRCCRPRPSGCRGMTSPTPKKRGGRSDDR